MYKHEYINRLLSNANLFYKEVLPSTSNIDMIPEIIYHEEQEENGGRAEIDTNVINIFSTDSFNGYDDLDSYSSSSVNIFGAQISRRDLDTFILIHEMAHKYSYKLYENNESYKAFMKIASGSNGDTIKNILFIRQNSANKNFNEMFARSVEDMYLEYMLSNKSIEESRKRNLSTFIKKRNEAFSKNECDLDNSQDFTLENNFFYRMKKICGERKMLDFLENVDMFKLGAIKRTTDGKFTDEYRNMIEDVDVYMEKTEKGFVYRDYYIKMQDLMKKWGFDYSYESHANKTNVVEDKRNIRIEDRIK